VYSFSYISVYKRPDGDWRSEPKRVAVKIFIMVLCVILYVYF